MKTKTLLLAVISAFSNLSALDSDLDPHIQAIQDANKRVHDAKAQLISKMGSFSDKEEGVALLRQVVLNDEMPVEMRLAAIRILGDIKDKDGVKLLLDHISLRNKLAIGSESIKAIGKIGESAMPETLVALEEAINTNAPRERISDLVLAVVNVKGYDRFAEWFEKARSSLDPKIRDAITTYAIRW